MHVSPMHGRARSHPPALFPRLTPACAAALVLGALAASCTTLRETITIDASGDTTSPFDPAGGGFPGPRGAGSGAGDVTQDAAVDGSLDAGALPETVGGPDGAPQTCTPDCEGRQCGTNGCGGLCGTCPLGHQCLPTGACTAEGGGVCQADCSGKACGSDGCGGLCGVCPGGLACLPDAKCGDPSLCTPSCVGKQCGPDGCDGLCGTCADGLLCSATGQCTGGTCAPSCAGKACGDDGCGGLCGTCPAGKSCAGGQCTGGGCTASCGGKGCGDDGCGGLCGVCPAGSKCAGGGQCICVPSCDGKQCGDDGCAGLCGLCPPGALCGANGACGCAPVPGEKSGPKCETAWFVGSLPDTGTTLMLEGVIATQEEVDWIRVEAVDTPDDLSCDQFHFRVRFASNPAGALTLNVSRSGCGPGDQLCTGTTNFEWMTDFLTGDTGECPCTVKQDLTDVGVHVCTDNSASFLIGVRHAPGVVGACTPYALEVTNGVY